MQQGRVEFTGRNGKMLPGTSSVLGGKECQTRVTNIGGYFYHFGKRVDGKETRSSKFGLRKRGPFLQCRSSLILRRPTSILTASRVL